MGLKTQDIFCFNFMKRYNTNMEKNEKIPEKKRFSIITRIRSTDNAWRGLGVMLKTTHNSWVEVFFAVIAIYFGFLFKISPTEWALVVFCIGLVIVAETINTAIEIDVDLTSPGYHPFARDIKDVSAGAVLMSAFIAGIVGLIIFLPKVIALL